MNRIAVIDIGSNTIKCLVAKRSPEGQLKSLFEKTLPVRISAGINAEEPVLSREAMDAGSDAVAYLVHECENRGPLSGVMIVATSAVRDAKNRDDFCRMVLLRAGHEVRVLSGLEEAALIGRGIREDPALSATTDTFCVADLGGGSLELLKFEASKVTHCESLRLGTIRLTERFIENPQLPLQSTDAAAIGKLVSETVERSGFPLAGPLIATGGVITVWRSMHALSQGLQLTEIAPELSAADLQTWIDQFQTVDWKTRKAIPGLPVQRADVIPTGFVTIQALLRMAGATLLKHSFYNLRYGVAARALAN